MEQKNLLEALEGMKFSGTSNTNARATRKRKDNPVEIKYEETSTTIKESAKEVKYDPNTKKNFEHMYGLIKEMRKDQNAAVDLYGCSENADKSAPKETQDFQTLVSLLISVQNRDESTAAAMERFKAHGLTVDSINAMSEEEVLRVMGGVNFNKTKAKNIKAAARLIADNHNGRVPDDWDKLLEFPGVGNKIAVILLNTAYKKNAGIGVDTHVHRVANRLGWAKTKLPDQTRVELESFVPKKYWSEVNRWMVGFGQQICQPINPKCDICLLNKLCPEGRKTVKEVKNKKKEAEEEEEFSEELQVKRTKKIKGNKDNLAEVKEEKTVKYVKKQSSIKKEEDEMKVKEEEDVVVKKEEVDMEDEMKIEDATIDDEDGYVVKKKVIGVVSVKKEEQETILEEIIKIEESEEVVPKKRVTRSSSRRSNN